MLGMVFIWFDAEGRPPQWELEEHKDVEAKLEAGSWYYGTMRQMSFDQHVSEMHMNSADGYHFQTLHEDMPLPWIGWLFKCRHEVQADYYHEGKWHICLFEEKMRDILFYGGIFSVPFASWVASKVTTRVTFEGPSIMHFRLDTPLGSMRQIKTLLPVEAFRQHAEVRWFAQGCVPRLVLRLMAIIGATALEQDRQVWENKMYHKKPKLVTGDGKFISFMKWYGQFYSQKSDAMANDEFRSYSHGVNCQDPSLDW